MHILTQAFLVAAFMLVPLAADAAPITERQKRDCKTDYDRFCSTHKLEDPALRSCFRKVRFQLTDKCVDALVAGGEMSPAMGEKLKAKQ